MLVQRWASVAEDGPTLKQHLVNVSCLLAGRLITILAEHSGSAWPTLCGFFQPETVAGLSLLQVAFFMQISVTSRQEELNKCRLNAVPALVECLVPVGFASTAIR